MSTEFPYLNDTQFPGLRSVDAFRSSSRFDYTRWGVGTTLGLCNVNFCGDYENVVKFADDAARDAYFDGVIAEELRLDTELRIMPNGSIKLPLPFDEAVRYNYLMADFSTATSDERPLPFETRDHVRRFYFFIKDATYVAPNCTECFLHLDEWTTYINRITINYMMLERGHAPMASITPEQFLSDPIANNSLLLADDVSFGEPVIASKSDFVPFGAGKKYVLAATTVPFEKLTELGRTNLIQPSDPGYYDTGERNGEGVGLIGPEYAAGDIDYSDLNLYTGTANTGAGSIANNLTVFAVAAEAVYLGGLFDIVVEMIPQFMQTIRAVFVVDESMIKLGVRAPFLIRRTMTWRELAATGKTWQDIADLGITYAQLDSNAGEYFGMVSSFSIYRVEPSNGTLCDIKLTTADFGYPDKYSKLAKLYTFPYAALEVSDDSGTVATVRIEETSSLSVQQRVSLAYPYIKFEAFLQGVGASGANEFEWRDLRNYESTASLPRGSFRDAIFAYDIPAFSLFMSGYDDYRLHNYNENNVVALNDAKTSYANAAYVANNAANNAVASADIAYQNANASAGTAQQNANSNANATYENAINSASVAFANAQRQAAVTLTNARRTNATAQENANASASAANSNALASNATAQENANASARTSQQNAVRSADLGVANTANTNAAATRNTALAVAANAANTAKNNDTQATITGYNNGLMQANQAWDAGYARTMNEYEAATQAVTSVTSGASSLGSALVGAATSTNTASAASLAGAGISAVANVVNTAVNVGFSVAKTEAGISNSQSKVGEAQQNATDNVAAQTSASTDITSRNNELATAQTENSVNAAASNATNSRNTDVQNANASYSNATANAQRTRDASDANASRSYGAATGNAQRTRDAADRNAAYVNNVTLDNAAANKSASLENAKRSLDVAIASADRTAGTYRSNVRNTRVVTIANAEASRAQSIDNARRELSTKMTNARAAYLDRRLDAPIEIGTASGDPTSDEMRTRGLQVRVLTQTAGAIAQAGDQMLRFGYTLNQSWSGHSLTPMPHFTYWKALDVWLTGEEGVIEHAQETIKNAIKRGVTVWRDADEIGKVSIYDNIG